MYIEYNTNNLGEKVKYNSGGDINGKVHREVVPQATAALERMK